MCWFCLLNGVSLQSLQRYDWIFEFNRKNHWKLKRFLFEFVVRSVDVRYLKFRKKGKATGLLECGYKNVTYNQNMWISIEYLPPPPPPPPPPIFVKYTSRDCKKLGIKMCELSIRINVARGHVSLKYLQNELHSSLVRAMLVQCSKICKLLIATLLVDSWRRHLLWYESSSCV